MERATSHGVDLATVQSALSSILAYAGWLESSAISWQHFPTRMSDRCLYQYRRSLIAARDDDKISPSTASSRMATVIRFYRWLKANELISPAWPMWQEKHFGIRTFDPVG